MAKKEGKLKVGEIKNKIAEENVQEINEPKVEVAVEENPATENPVADKPATEKPEKVIIKPQPTQDAMDNRKIAWLAYLLFFIPLLINKNSEFVRHNANEGLEINIFDAVGLILLLVGVCVKTTNASIHLMLIIFTIIGLGLLVLTIITKIYMIVVSCQGKKVNTPWMWDIKIIK